MFVGVALSLAMLRSVRLATLVIFSAFITVYFTLALVPVTNGSMNMVLVVMPTLLMVLTMSGAIHVANYWKHAAIKTPEKAVPNAFRLAWKPCFLASVTTAIGLSSLGTSPLVPVRDFGIYSGRWLFDCLHRRALRFAFVITVLAQQKSECTKSQLQALATPRWLSLPTPPSSSHPVCIVAAVASTFGLKYFSTETKVIRYFPEDNKVVQDYHFIEGNLVHIVGVDTIVKFKAKALDDMTIVERMEVGPQTGRTNPPTSRNQRHRLVWRTFLKRPKEPDSQKEQNRVADSACSTPELKPSVAPTKLKKTDP